MSEIEYPPCQWEGRCSRGALLALFDSDGNHLANTCMAHCGEVIWAHNKFTDTFADAEPEDISVHPLYREGIRTVHISSDGSPPSTAELDAMTRRPVPAREYRSMRDAALADEDEECICGHPRAAHDDICTRCETLDDAHHHLFKREDD